MVFFFTSSEGYEMYMGADKFENEHLIKYGLPEDVWFHVDDMSSAHVYLRLKEDQRLEDVSQETVIECAQLVKANSIEGCKAHEVYVIYTRWRNLNKTSDMDVGSIGFHNKGNVKRILVEKDKEIVKRINKTKQERFPDLAELQQERAARFRATQKAEKREQFLQGKAVQKEREAQARLKNYSSFMVDEKMTTNTDMHATVDDSAARKFEEDFM